LLTKKEVGFPKKEVGGGEFFFFEGIQGGEGGKTMVRFMGVTAKKPVGGGVGRRPRKREEKKRTNPHT